ncbi:glycine betaine ABC transporter substrate-binding protein [Nocardia rhizosphaerae]|uniref:Glycine betaine ABC transporter substrate-binding protein n=1 Tax=Nocardia rhizosphaerae TaxID=1691571 RepID=A0ABV8L5J4_9NOCA
MVSGALRSAVAAFLLTTCAFTTISCAGGEPERVVAVGADSSTESVLLAQIYAQALARTGTAAVVRDSATPMADLDAGRITVLPARNGALLDRWNPESAANTPAAVGAAVNAALPQGLSVSDPADGTDLRPRLLVTPELGITTVADLDPRCAELTAGTATVAGLDPVRVPAVAGCAVRTARAYPDPAALRHALRAGEVGVGIVNGPPADPDLADLLVLDDPDYALRAENILTVYRSGVFDRRQLKKLNYVAGELTTEELVDLVRQAENGAEASVLARTWLDDHGL